MDDRDLRLDGNAVAGLLAEVFAVEPTVAWTNCAGCGASRQVGALVAYCHGMGAVLRCPDCNQALLRLGHAPGRVWLDLRGMRWLQLEVGAD
ncbi:MAG TPA: DUF6510 family protein [Actinomycetes bacterium]|jgi:hypothetical protein|nr:DUF6510 family protein [Actinomycetes bacterium]